MTILVLGGGWQQLPAIRKAREMGLRVIVADYLESAPGRRRIGFIWSAPEIGK